MKENEKETSAEIINRIFEDGNNVPIASENFDLPPWFDINKYKKGQKYFHKNFFSMFVAKLCGLIMMLTIPSVVDILILTGKSTTPSKAFRRYINTISYMIDWYNSNPTNKNSKFYKTVISIRKKHNAASKRSVNNGFHMISQKDLALTQFGFVGFIILKKEFLGIKGNKEEEEGFIHFWRTIGYFMGIEDRFNICVEDTEHVTQICEKLIESVFKPALFNSSNDFQKVSQALLTGMKLVVPVLSTDGFMEFIRRTIELPSLELNTFYARSMLSLQIIVHKILQTVHWITFILRPLLNYALKFSIFVNYNFPLVPTIILGKEAWKD